MRRVERAEAMRRVEAAATDGCLPCRLVEDAVWLRESVHAVAVLSRFPTRWGHLLVIPRRHATSLEALPAAEWADAATLAHAAGRAVEHALDPARVYVASLGTDEPDLPMTFPHLHFHVIPVAEPGARPAEVLTWKHGIYEGTPAEWAALREALLVAWP